MLTFRMSFCRTCVDASRPRTGPKKRPSWINRKTCRSLIQKLAHHWMTGIDWRACEAKLKAPPQFITEIDELDIHFVHVRSQHEDALALVVNHGWPDSMIEQLQIIDRLTNPTAHGASAAPIWSFRRCQ